LIFLYNFLMLVLLGVSLPIWIPLVAFREKHRRPFFKRLHMRALAGDSHALEHDQAAQRIWIHALSVGEVLSAEPLVKALAQKHGRGKLVFSASTQTGFAMATRVIAPHVHALRHFPYDTFFSVNRALEVIQPRQVVIVETDIWPNFLTRLKRRRIPVCLVNARLSDRSWRGYRRIDFLMAPLLSVFGRIGVQTDSDRQRFLEIGVRGEKLVTVGNIKFDQEPVGMATDDLNRFGQQFNLAPDTSVWVAGSTHEGEEEILVEAYQRLRAAGIQAVLMVAPRDPGRAMAVCRIFKRCGIDAVSMTQLAGQPGPSNVVVIDRIGILRRLYALADVAFVGGSLVKAGGHNPLEPASVAKPVLFGPYTDDFRWICRALEQAGGAIRVDNADQLAEKVRRLISNQAEGRYVGSCAHKVFAENRGAVERTLAIVEAIR
jgi:3-deoxy-D-manno-octulosonic-acid transferase